MRLLKCEHEEADDCIMYHISHAVNVDRYSRVIVASADIDVFVCLLFNFTHWVHLDIKELWMLCGQGTPTQYVPIHTLVVSVLPAVHALGGCDTSSKVGTKRASLNFAQEYGFKKLFRFGIGQLTEEMLSSAERLLVNCISKSRDFETDDLRYKAFHKHSFQLDIEKLPCTSNAITLHKQRAYSQCYLWTHVAYLERRYSSKTNRLWLQFKYK